MNKKISIGIAISLVAIGCAITFVLTWTVSLNIYNSKIGTSEKYEGVYAKLREIDTTVRQNYVDISKVSDEMLEISTIRGYIAGTGDKYAYYSTPSAYYELKQTNDGVILGAGIKAEEDGSGYLKITTVYKGSSAELNGIKAGDIITAIDGKSLLSMEQGDALERLSGEIGTRLALQLLRDDGESISVNLMRQQIDIESVTHKLLDGDIGYIRISTFNAKTPEQFSEALTALAGSAKALIIDVRQNSGGVISALKPILNQFIASSIVATTEYSDGSRKSLIETDSETSTSLPAAVLVDGGTVSAAELFAAVMRDEYGAVIVGSQTFGKAVMQKTYAFSDGSALTISVGIIHTKSGTWNETGIKPDYSVESAAGTAPDSITADADAQLQKAIEVLTPRITE